MRTRRYRHCAIGIALATAFLAACGGAQLPFGTAAVNHDTAGARIGRSGSYRVIFKFDRADGVMPLGLTIPKPGGVFYGVTEYGGSNDAGTFFTLTMSGDQRVLDDLTSEYGNPTSGLTALGDKLYGMSNQQTSCGGNNCVGAVFSLSRSGRVKILHVFSRAHSRGGDGPFGLTTLNGVLYGVTRGGGDLSCGYYGRFGCGTVFSLTPSGDFHILHRFRGTLDHGPDGYWPISILTYNGTLYGITEYGGATGNGSVFSITTAGKERVVYSFGNQYSSDGEVPNSLTVLGGTLYGTTQAGGNDACGSQRPPIGCGAVFSVTTAGAEQVLYRFKGGSDGGGPGELVAMDGKLYGTTGYGSNPCGGIFSITSRGEEETLFNFPIHRHMCAAPSSLTPLKHTLYGTTSNMGARHSGTAFAFTP